MACRDGCGAGLRSLRAAVCVFLHGLSAGNKSLLSVSLLARLPPNYPPLHRRPFLLLVRAFNSPLFVSLAKDFFL